jgi:aminopeptidase N
MTSLHSGLPGRSIRRVPRRHGVAVAGGALCALVASVLVGPAADAAPGDAAEVAAGAPSRPSPGAVDVGDPLYPGLGNGGYQVLRYDLDLRYATAAPSQQLDGTVAVSAVASQALSRFDLDFSGDSVGSVTVDGRPATFARQGEELVVTPSRPIAKGSPFVVKIAHFTSTPTVPNPDEFLTTVFVQTPDGTVWSGQPNGAHRIFPSNDHPSDKASFSFRVDVPSGTTAVANGELRRKDTRAGRTVWEYEQREPMATELAQVAVGALTVVPRPRNDGTVVRDVVPTRLVAEYGPKLAGVNGQLTWMEKQVGDYPFRSYGSLIADADLGFALETQTLSLYDKVFFDESQGGVPGFYNPVMVHELAHQWFGDSVAPSRWGDIWQNEGHATWYEFRYAAETGTLADDVGIADFTELMKVLYSLGDVYRDRYGPVGAPRSGSPDDLFNNNVYFGGALVLYALQQKIGAATFQRVERAWVSTYRGRSASTAEFIALASRVSGQDLSGFLKDWLYGTTTPPMPGHPDWTVNPVPAAAAARAAAPADPLKPFRRH